MNDAITRALEALAETLGLSLSSAGADRLALERHGLSVSFERELLHAVSTPRLGARFGASAILFGIRLGLDQLAVPVAPAPLPKLGPRKVIRPQEVPSIYGEHLLRIVPSLSLDWCQAIAPAAALFRTPWLQPGLETALIEETGRTLDIMRLDQAQARRGSEGDDKLERDARAALFYDSYGIRPARSMSFAHGAIRVYETIEGLGASRALILPEYDWDAAQDTGFCAIPSRDVLLVAQPGAPEHREQIRTQLAEVAAQVLAQTAFPLSTAIFALSVDGLALDSSLQLSEALPTGAPGPPPDLLVKRL
ncbi:MAG: hypothetical protein H0U74_14435 [Bradymonadaceae bacterium]|nr:hypothetical protein [Lujinxingiaceae bacterium]